GFGPTGLFVFLLFWLMRRAGNVQNLLGNFGRSRAQRYQPTGDKVTFADVAGIDEAKEELSEVVDFLRHPDKYRKLGGRIPHGVLLSGPPGTGKTLLARAVAGEADVPFFSIAASAGPVRPTRRGATAGSRRPGGDSQGAQPPRASRAGRRPHPHRCDHAGHGRSGSRQPRQRGGADGGAPESRESDGGGLHRLTRANRPRRGA